MLKNIFYSYISRPNILYLWLEFFIKNPKHVNKYLLEIYFD